MAAFEKGGIEATVDGLMLGAVPDDCKSVVIGVDFGTAYSGVAYAYKADPKTIYAGAPTSIDNQQMKVPTSLLLKEDGFWVFGNEAEHDYHEGLIGHLINNVGEGPKEKLFRRFKMVLKDKNSGMNTLTADSVDGKPHNLMKLVTVSLQKLAEYALEKVSTGWGAAHRHLDPKNDVQWVLTVPAIWNDFGKAFMRKAAFKAGWIAEENSENLMLVLEPEGASLAVHVGASSHSLLRDGSRFMVLDCGGGTVDITVHAVDTVTPLMMRAIAPPSGGAWGGDNVNIRFHDFLKELLGPELYQVKAMPYEFHKIGLDFDKIKINFNPSHDPGNISLREVLSDFPQLLSLSEAFNARNSHKPIKISPALRKGFLTMSKELMMSFFSPLLDATVNDTRRILRNIGGIHFIIVVGGFGSSKVLVDRIRSEFNDKDGVVVIMPNGRPKPQGAIAQGSVYYGLYKFYLQSRVSAYTYGYAVVRNDISGYFQKMITKGDELPINHEHRETFYPAKLEYTSTTLSIYRSDQLDPEMVDTEVYLGRLDVDCPEKTREERRKVGVLLFGGAEIKVKIISTSGDVVNGIVKIE